jgi:hypothetical protein
MAEWTLTGPEQQAAPRWQLTGPDKEEEEKKGPLDGWHSAIDPVTAFGGYLGLLSMAIPAGPGGPLATMPRMAPAVPKPVNPTAEAAQRIGVELPNVALGGPVQKNIAQKLADIPLVGAPIEAQSQKAITQIGEAATRAEQGFGGKSVPQAGADARDSITNYMQNVTKAQQEALYKNVEGYLKPGQAVPLSNTSRVVAQIQGQRMNAAQGPSSAVKMVEEAISRPGMDYRGIKNLRTSIGEAAEPSFAKPLPAGVSQAELKQLYGALSEDLKQSVKHGGPNATAAFEKANSYSASVAKERQNLYRIVGAKSDEAVVDRLLAAASSSSRGDYQLLQQARGAMNPAAWDGVSSAAIARLGRDNVGNFSPDRFLTAWAKISPHGKALLFRSTGKNSLAKSLDDIAEVSKTFKELSRYTNQSKTGASIATISTVTGAIAAPLTTLTALFTGRVMAHLLAKPITARAVASYSRAALSGPQKAALAAKPLAVAIGRELNLPPDVVNRMIAELQGSGTGQADQAPDQVQ